MRRGVSVVVVAYGAPEALREAIAPLVDEWSVFVVDNSSDDRIRRLCVEVGASYVDPGANTGFARGVNTGLRHVPVEHDVLLLNPDAVLEAEGLHALHEALVRDTGVAAVAPALQGPTESQRLWWPFPTPARAWWEAAGAGRWLERHREFLVGAVLLLRREALEQVGTFDERFFLYAEETDWQRRAAQLGWRLHAAEQITARHAGGGTSTDPSRRDVLFHCGQETYIRKWYGRAGWQRYRLAVVLGCVPRMLLGSPASVLARSRLLLYVRGPRRVATSRALLPATLEPPRPVRVHPPSSPQAGSSWWVILNWNGLDDTRELLEDLRADHQDLVVVVVDNGSRDGSEEALRAEFPWVHLLQAGTNLGFSGGNNLGLAYALQQGASVVGVLNNDTRIAGQVLRELAQHVVSHPDDVASPDIRYDDPEAQEESWFRGGRVDRRTGWPHHVTGHAQLSLPRTGVYRTEIVTGCCLVATSSMWYRVGLFDESFFLIFEDSDWSMRASAHGNLVVLPTAVLRHKVSRSFTGSAAALSTYYYLRNGLRFAHRYGRTGARWRFLVRFGLRESVRDVRGASSGTSVRAWMRYYAVADYSRQRWGAAPPRAVSRAGSR